VSHGRYRDEAAAIKDARQRVSFLEKNDVYVDDARLAKASWDLRATEALISAHNLEPVIRANGGELPEAGRSNESAAPTASTAAEASEPAASAVARTPRSAAAEPARKSKSVSDRSTTDVFGAIDLDLRNGLSRQQIITKLTGEGLSSDNAADAYDFVLAQRRQKQRGRMLAVAVVAGLGLVFFFLSRFFV